MSTFSENHLEKVISFIDEVSAKDNDFRKSVLIAFKRNFGFHQSNFWVNDEYNNLQDPVSLNSVDSLNDYLSNYTNLDILVPNKIPNLLKKEQRLIGLLDILTPTEHENSVYYNEFMKKHGYYHNFGLFLYKEDKILGLIDFSWSKNEHFLSAEDRACLELLSKFLSEKFFEIRKISSSNADTYLSALNHLSSREKDVLKLIQIGLSNKDIAHELFISVNTVKKHVQSLYQKFNVNNRASLAYKISKMENPFTDSVI